MYKVTRTNERGTTIQDCCCLWTYLVLVLVQGLQRFVCGLTWYWYLSMAYRDMSVDLPGAGTCPRLTEIYLWTYLVLVLVQGLQRFVCGLTWCWYLSMTYRDLSVDLPGAGTCP